MKVTQLMTREVKTCSRHDSLNAAARIMWENDCGSVPVVDGDSRVVGMITDRDICMAAYTQGRTVGEIPVESAMAHHMISCAAEDDLDVAERLMQENRVHRLPVLDSGGRAVGILSLGDIARWAISTSKRRPKRASTSAQIAYTLGAICQLRARAEGSVAPAPGKAETGLRATRGARLERLRPS